MPRSERLSEARRYLPFLLGMIQARDWSSFEGYALSNPKTFQRISESISNCQEFNGMTLLHACVRYDPPADILLKMIELHPEALRTMDCIGRTPLHVAAGSGASSPVVKILAAKYPRACNIQDEDGRTPLHFACDAECELFEEETSPKGPLSLETIYALLAGSLDAVLLEDADDMSAVEYALLSDAPIEIVTLLQKAAQQVIKNKANGSVPSHSSARSSQATTKIY